MSASTDQKAMLKTCESCNKRRWWFQMKRVVIKTPFSDHPTLEITRCYKCEPAEQTKWNEFWRWATGEYFHAE